MDRNLDSYLDPDRWDADDEAPELVTCPRCEGVFLDGEGGRISPTVYVCTPCYYADPVIAAELHRHGKDEPCPF